MFFLYLACFSFFEVTKKMIQIWLIISELTYEGSGPH